MTVYEKSIDKIGQNIDAKNRYYTHFLLLFGSFPWSCNRICSADRNGPFASQCALEFADWLLGALSACGPKSRRSGWYAPALETPNDTKTGRLSLVCRPFSAFRQTGRICENFSRIV